MEIYLVGGAVRDQLLGTPVYDRDWVVVGATPHEMLARGFRQVGADFPVFLHPETHEEYALARTERKQGHGYHGFTVYSAPDVTLEEDLQRRDLTINAMAQSEGGALIDPFGGQQDLRQRILRHVSPAFQEDPLRILRLARFAARLQPLGFKVAAETLDLMRAMVASGEADHLVPERVWQETQRALNEQSPRSYFEVLRACGALEVVMPELEKLFQASPEAGELALEKLSQAHLLSDGTSAAFAALTLNLEPNQLQCLCERLKVPNDCRELALLASALHRDIRQAPSLPAEALLEILNKADAWRRPERFLLLLKVCEAEARALKDNSQTGSAGKLLQDALAEAQTVQASRFIEQGITGKAIGQAMRDARLARIHSLLV